MDINLKNNHLQNCNLFHKKKVLSMLTALEIYRNIMEIVNPDMIIFQCNSFGVT